MNGKHTNKGRGFDNPEMKKNINREGGNRGLKRTIRETLISITQSDTGEIQIPADRVVRVNPDGSVAIKMPTTAALVQQLIALAFSKDQRVALAAINSIIDHTEGRAKQSVEVTEVKAPNLPEWMDEEDNERQG